MDVHINLSTKMIYYLILTIIFLHFQIKPKTSIRSVKCMYSYEFYNLPELLSVKGHCQSFIHGRIHLYKTIPDNYIQYIF